MSELAKLQAYQREMGLATDESDTPLWYPADAPDYVKAFIPRYPLPIDPRAVGWAELRMKQLGLDIDEP